MKYTDLLVVHGGLIGATPGHHHLSEPGIDLLRQRADEPEELDAYLEAQTKRDSKCQRQKVNTSSSMHSHSSSVSSTSSDASSQTRPDHHKRWSSSWRDFKSGIKSHSRSNSKSRPEQ